MGFGDGLHDGQAKPESAGFAAAVWLGAGETAEDAVQVGGRDAAAGVGHGDDGLPVIEADADFDAVTRLGVSDGVLQQGIQGHDKPVIVTEHGGLGHLPQPPVARHMTPAFQRVEDQGIGCHRRHLQEARSPGRGQQQEPVGQPTQPRQLAGDHPGVRGHLDVGGRLRDELRMAERDGDRGTQLMRGVLQELALLFQQAQVFLGDPVHLFHGGQPFLGGCQPPAAMPDHHQEHQRDQRDLGQVVGVLLPLEDLHADDAAGGQRHRRPGQDGRLQAPQPEAVDNGQAHPDDQERDRLPGRQQPHRGQVEAHEHRPGDVRRDRADPPQAVAQRRGDTGRPRGAVAGLQLRRGWLVAAAKILRLHDPQACTGAGSRSNRRYASR